MKRSMYLFALLLASAWSALAAQGQSQGDIRKFPGAVTGEYIVVLNDDTPHDTIPAVARELAAQNGGNLRRVWQDAIKGFFVQMNEAQALALSRNPKVKYVEQNSQVFMSTPGPTRVDPSCTPPSNCPVNDNRLWHLDTLDQNDAIPSNGYSYCEDSGASTVYVYILDGGVLRQHHEFGNDPARVVTGYNASGDGDFYPAYDPCHGLPGSTDIDAFREQWIVGHGTGVGSVVAGQYVGVAPHAVIVPIKANRCAEWAAKYRDDIRNNNTHFDVGAWIFAPSRTNIADTYYVCVTAGNTANTAGAWDANGLYQPWASGGTITDGSAQWQKVTPVASDKMRTVQMLIDGLDWILRTGTGGNPNPKSPAVVSTSMYQVVGNTLVDCVNHPTAACSTTFEDAIQNLLKYNNGQGITVVASANNQDANACDTSPGRLSRGSPNNTNDPNHPYKVITAGGTMLRNNPDPNPADGGPNVQHAEPNYDSSKPTRFARWRCWQGDSDNCSANITGTYTTPDPNLNPNGYINWTLGSNGGQCVTLFAPAKNMSVAALVADGSGGATMYRDSRASGGDASGTSWSAPFVAGVVARILQSHPTYTVDNVYDALMSHTTADLDPTDLNPPNVTGTPNNVLQFRDASVDPLPSTNTGTVTATGHGTGTLTYQWYQVNSDFNTSQYSSNAAASTAMSGQTSATLTLNPPPTTTTSYFVRVTSNCGSADSNFTTYNACTTASITTQPTASPGVIGQGGSATLTIVVAGSTPTVQWYTSQNVNVGSGTSLPVTPTSTTTYYATVSNSCTQAITSANVTVTVMPAPGSFSAHTNADGSNITISWAAVPGATSYQVKRSSTWGGTFSNLGSAVTTTSTTDGPFTGAVATYVYVVHAINGNASSPASTKDYATAAGTLFQDPTITVGQTIIAKQHILDLRAAVDAVRVALGTTAATWSDPLTDITANSINEVRNRLNDARNLFGVGLGNYPYSSSIIANNPIFKTQMDENREAVK